MNCRKNDIASLRILLWMTPISLYLHVPFCARKCRYCDFYSVTTDDGRIQRYLTAVSREIDCRHDHPELSSAMVQTVFFGGGTPTVLSTGKLAEACGLIRSGFSLAHDVEWTVECNPDSFTSEKAEALLDLGVTRLTFGIQSLDDRELSRLGRIHSAAQSMAALNDKILGRFQSIGVDVMYGIPGQTAASLDRTISSLIALPFIVHISAYELTVAEGTPFGRHRARLPVIGDETMSAMTGQLWNRLAEAGFEQYEVSNFARPGYRCRHNEAYWDHQPYLGFGPAAHSYIHPVRWANVKDIDRFIAMTATGERPTEFTETLDPRMLAEEMVFLGLRRARGIDEMRFMEKCGTSLIEMVESKKLEYFQRAGLIQYEKPFWRPTPKGMLMADGMARELCSYKAGD
jgi:oxygen-independent coproporphyrinogen-3 oxidase